MAADEPTTRGDADLEATHLNPLLDGTVLDYTVVDDAARRTGVNGDATPDERESGADEAEEEWPPREWRETTRAAGQRQAAYVALGMVVIFAVLVLIAIWASHNG